MSADWPKVRLGDVLTLQRRWLTPELDRQYVEIGVRSFGRGIFHKAPVTGADLGNKRVLRIEPGDLVLMNVFAWEGAVAVAGSAEAGTIGSHRYATYTMDANRCCPEFLNLYFKTAEGRDLLARVSPGSAGRNRTLNLTRFAEQRVPIPSLTEQLRIVARVQGLTGRIDEVASVRRSQRQEIKSLLQAQFARIAADAPRLPLVDVAPLVRRPVQVELNAGYPELGVRSFGRGTFHKPALPGTAVGTKKLYEVRGGDLLFNIVFAWEGAIAVATHKDDGRVGSHRFLTCVPDPEVATAQFICFYFLTPDGLAQVGAASPGGAGRNRTLGLQSSSRLQIPLPNLQRQRDFDALRGKMDQVLRDQDLAQRELEAVVPAVISRAFRGES